MAKLVDVRRRFTWEGKSKKLWMMWPTSNISVHNVCAGSSHVMVFIFSGLYE